jgi:hypothetical protein
VTDRIQIADDPRTALTCDHKRISHTDLKSRDSSPYIPLHRGSLRAPSCLLALEHNNNSEAFWVSVRICGTSNRRRVKSVPRAKKTALRIPDRIGVGYRRGADQLHWQHWGIRWTVRDRSSERLEGWDTQRFCASGDTDAALRNPFVAASKERTRKLSCAKSSSWFESL